MRLIYLAAVALAVPGIPAASAQVPSPGPPQTGRAGPAVPAVWTGQRVFNGDRMSCLRRSSAALRSAGYASEGPPQAGWVGVYGMDGRRLISAVARCDMSGLIAMFVAAPHGTTENLEAEANRLLEVFARQTG